MRDLISRSELIKELNKYCGSQRYLVSENIREIINNQPTYDIDKVVDQIKTLSPANYVSKDDVLKIVKGDNFSQKSEKNSFFNFDEVLRIECEKARSKAIDDFVAGFKNKDSELRKSCDNWYEFADRIAEQLKKEVEE